MTVQRLAQARKHLFLALGIDMIFTAMVLVSDIWALDIFAEIRGGSVTVDQPLLDRLTFWESFARILLLTVAAVGIALVRWLGACYEHAKLALDASGFEQEGWRTWGWIVPFANIVKPYKVLCELYKAGGAHTGGDSWKRESGSGWLLSWWLFWLVTHLVMWSVTKMMMRTAMKSDLSLDQVVELYGANLVACTLSLLVAASWFWVAGRLTGRLLDHPLVGARSSPAEGPGPITPQRSTTPDAPAASGVPDDGERAARHGDIDEDAIYARIADELETGHADKGLWTRLYAECDGDEKRVKVRYIALRAERLIAAERDRLTQSVG